MHQVVLVKRQLGLFAAILVLHPDVMLDTTCAAAHRFRQREARCLRTGKEVEILVLRTVGQFERTGPGEMHEIVGHQFRHRPCERLHVVRHDAIIVTRPKRGVIIGRTRRKTLVVLNSIAGDIVEDLQISCEVRNYFYEAR